MGRKYDESGFEQFLMWDPRIAIPGAVLAVMSVVAIQRGWPTLWPGLVLMGLAVGLITLGLNAKMGVRVEPGRFLVIWRVGSLRRERVITADQAWVRCAPRRGGRGAGFGWTVRIGRGWMAYDTFINVRSEAEAQEWMVFLREIAAGERPRMPDGSHQSEQRRTGG